MHIVTWNCCRGPRDRKLAALEGLAADLAVIQECPRPTSESEQSLWFGDNPRQGINVVASGAYAVRRVPAVAEVPNYAFPVTVVGPVPCQLLVVWAKYSRTYPYVEAVVRAVECYRAFIADAPTLLIGDLNSNAVWDAEHSNESNHSALVRMLSELGMVSVYHEFFHEAHGAESQPTFHLYRKRTRPYHLDYCFAPRAWLPVLRSVEIGPFEHWGAVSDHLPLRVEFELGALEA